MSNVVSFTDYTPSARYDGQSWTSLRIDEAEALAGPWTTIDTLALDPLDADPTAPATRSFTTENATLDAGWYRVVFLDADGNEQLTEPVAFPPPAVPSVRPTVAEVAALERARTYVDGDLVGTFNDDTRPTAAQVEELIEMAVGDVAARVAVTLRPEFWGEARRLASVQAAALIETSFFPEQLDSDQSAFRQYSAMYLTGVQALSALAQQPTALRLS